MKALKIGKRTAILFILLLGGCGGGGSSDGGDPNSVANTAAATYLSNVQNGPDEIKLIQELGADKALEVRDKKTGEVYEVFGSKDVQGNIVEVQKTTHTDASGVKTIVENDGAGGKIVTRNDTRMTITPQSNGQTLVEIIDGESNINLKTTITPPAVAYQSSFSLASTTKVLAGTVSSTNKIIANISTKNCGVPGDAPARVVAYFNDSTGKFLSSHTATKVADGQYRAEIPNPTNEAPLSMGFIKSSLESLNTALDIACKADSASPFAAAYACAQVSAAVASTGIGVVPAAKILAVCEAGVVAIKASCVIKGKLPNLPVPEAIEASGAELVKSIEQLVIDAIPDNINPQISVTLDTIPARTSAAVAPIPAASATVNIELNLDDLVVGDIILSPSAPSAGTGYQASAALRCATNNSSAKMDVIGTDGYSDSITETFTAPTNKTIVLQVPGADEAGISDTVTLTVTTASGGIIKKQAFLVFQ